MILWMVKYNIMTPIELIYSFVAEKLKGNIHRLADIDKRPAYFEEGVDEE